MRISVCDGSDRSRKQIVHWIRQYCTVYGIEMEIAGHPNAEELFREMSMRRFTAVFMGLDGPEGFLSARRLWETDKQVKLVFVCDTDQYAVRGVRLHFVDYIVRPVEFKHVARAMRLMGELGGS